MKSKRAVICLILIIPFATIFFACTSTLNLVLMGGNLVEPDYQPKKILISYRSEGKVPEGYRYLLVETDKGEAIWEKHPDKTGALFEAYRRNDEGEHFSCWAVGQPANEIVVPFDRSQPAKKYVYPVGKYQADRGTLAVVPLESFQPVAILYPEQ